MNIKGERWNICKTAVCLRPFVFHDKDICITSNICCGKDFFAIYFKFVFKIIRSLVKIKSSVFAVTVNEKLKLSLQSSIILWYYLCYIFPASFTCAPRKTVELRRTLNIVKVVDNWRGFPGISCYWKVFSASRKGRYPHEFRGYHEEFTLSFGRSQQRQICLNRCS